MYCPRCNLHSEEYVDRCPLCDGPMEADEFAEEVIKPSRQETPLQADQRSDKAPLKSDTQQIYWEGPETVAVDQDLIGQDIDEAGGHGDADDFSFPVSDNRRAEAESGIHAAPDDFSEGDTTAGPEAKSRTMLLMLLGIIIMAAAGYFFFFSSDGDQTLQPDPASVQTASDAGSVPSEQAQPGEALVPADSGAGAASSGPEVMAPAEPLPAEPSGLESSGALVPAPQPEPAAEPSLPEPQGGADSGKAPAQSPVPDAAETAPVATPPAIEPSPSLPAAPTAEGSYAIHVGSFKTEARAAGLKQELIQKGYPASTARVTIPGKGDWYRVMIGAYGTASEAASVADRLAREEKLPTWIMHR